MSKKDISLDLKRKSPQHEKRLGAKAMHNEKGITAIREMDSRGKTLDSDFNEEGVKHRAKATGQHGETGVLDTCKELIKKMNSEGSNWGEPEDLSKKGGKHEQGIDCVAEDTTNSEIKLQMQVTRAITDQDYWKDLSPKRGVEIETTYEQCANELFDTIMKKAKSMTPDIRKDITMVLDASIAQYLGHEAVVSKFQELYGTKIQALRFKEVWVVGHDEDLTYRLDSNNM